MAGGLRCEEIYNILTEDIIEDNNTLLILIPKTRGGDPKSFVVMGKLRGVINKYRALRPENVPTNKFFITYRKGKCTNQVIGVNKICVMPKTIATFLGKENSDSYSGHSFRVTSAKSLIDAGANITSPETRDDCKSTAEPEGYLKVAVSNQKRTYSKITDPIEIETTPKKFQLLNQLLTSTSQSTFASTSKGEIVLTPSNKENMLNPGKTSLSLYTIDDQMINRSET